jgi:asparagine N-glycosylation enzyme membrane subunit Stt3
LTAADERYLRKNQFLYRLRDMLKVSGQAGGGAMSFWDMGHKILYITGLGVVSNNFGLHIGRDSYRDWAAFFLADDEKAAEAILEKRNIRFVIADFDLAALNSAALYLGRDPGEYYWRGGPAAEFRAKFFRTMFCRFTLPSGEMSAPGLDGFRLILDSQMDGKAGYPTAWERVAGARLALRGEPGGGALISYEFVSPAGRRRVYLNSIKLDAKGEGEARVPYSSERPDLGHTARYRVIQGSAILELAVGEKDVILGNTIPVALGKRKAGG